MKKSKDITKYTVEWQIARVRAKKAKKCEDKLEIVKTYFDDKTTYSRFERSYNWTEGLLRGYKDQINKAKTAAFLDYLEKNKPQYSSIDLDHDDFSITEPELIRFLYKDLYKRTQKWLQQGYAHKEQITFLHNLAKECEHTLESILNTRSYDINTITHLTENKPHNNYKFLFS